jgi:cold-inducible RNA-binding protein
MTNRLYVGNLPSSATEEDLEKRFCRSGTVRSVAIATGGGPTHSRRFGIVEMSSHAEAQAAIGRLNMTQFDESVISVSLATIDQQRKLSEE